MNLPLPSVSPAVAKPQQAPPAQQSSSPVEVELVEFVTSRGASPQVEPDRGVIRNVKVLGPVSRNGRVYPRQTMEKAAGLYQRVRVNVNHPQGDPAAPRRYEDRLGYLDQVRVTEQGLFADLHFNPHHAVARQLAWDAQHAPENVGLSHNIRARLKQQEDRWLVEEILQVHSVDLVADPATTTGLFESIQGRVSSGPEASKQFPSRLPEQCGWLQQLMEQTLRHHGCSPSMLPPRLWRLLLRQPPDEALAVLQEWIAAVHYQGGGAPVQSAPPEPPQPAGDIRHWARSLT